MSPPNHSPTRANELPEPDAAAMAHQRQLQETIHNQIETAGGAISFEQYMQAALYMPGMGYYRCGTQKFGAAGDFITAPETSPLFSQCLARFVVQTGLKQSVLEVGAGSGILAANILQALKKQNALPGRYSILELSAELRARQQQTIERIVPDVMDRVQWLDDLPHDFVGVVLANELLDAMPVRRFHLEHGDLYEQYVSVDKTAFCYQDRPISDERLRQRIKQLEAQTSFARSREYLSEVNFMAEDWVRSVGERLKQAVVLLIDYGYPRNAYYHEQRNAGTLMCHYQHRAHADPLILTGLQDITAYVDFTAIADAALDAGLEVCGFTTQAHFLMNQGLLENIDADADNVPEYVRATTEIKKLTLPNEMGEHFKVMALSKNHDELVPGFEQFDLRHLL